MRVALDATPLSLTSGGLARYTAELSRALAETFPGDEYLLLSDQPFPAPAGPRNLQPAGGRRNAPQRRWWSWGLPRELARRRVDVFHGTNFEVPVLPLRPSVMTLHDLSPWMEPGWQAGAGRVRSRAPLEIQLGLAKRIIVPTQSVERRAISHFGIPPHRVVAVPEAAAPQFRPVKPPGRPPYFLFVGTLEPRKNLPLLVEAWRAVRARHAIDLVIAGRRRADSPDLPCAAGLDLAGEVSDAELATLYSGALACVFPSLYEGFCLPVLEAMQCGAAVIASRDPAIVEVAGGAAIHLDAADARGWAEALEAAAARPESLAELRARSLRRAAAFSWERTARLTHAVYEAVLAP